MAVQPKDVKPILIMGAGTVGNRAADLLLSLGFRLKLAKYDARVHEDGSYEIKSRELQEVYARHPQAKIEMYAARGSDLAARVQRLNEAGFPCKGSTDDIDFEDVSLAIDCSNGMERRNIQEIYEPHNLRFALNGGAEPTLVNRRFFASFPGCPASINPLDYVRYNAMITSCNTHCVTTALALMRETVGAEEFGERIRDITVTFCRRHEDPHKGKARPEFTSMKVKDYHLDEIMSLVPETEGLIHSVVSKWPTEYFHTLIIDFDFHGPVSDQVLARCQRMFERYRRGILATDEVNHEKTILASHWAGIADGDIPFPVYLVNRVSRYKMKLLALTPQRGIVAPSTVDYVLLRTGVAATWSEAFNYTNDNARYRGQSFVHIKNSVQYNLEPRFYEELLEERGSVWRAADLREQGDLAKRGARDNH